MANTNGNVNNGRLIAQQALRTLLVLFPALGKIARNFSNDTLRFGETLNAHVVTATEAEDFDPAVGYVASDRAQVNVPVVLNKHIHHTYSVGEQERSSSVIDLIDRYALTAAHSLGKKIYSDLFGLFTAANYANATVKAVGAFDRPAVVDISTALSDRDVPDMDRSLILKPSYYGALCKDLDIVGNNTNPAGKITTRKISDVHGFEVSEFSALPANGENLVGVALCPEAVGIVTALPEKPQVREGGMMTVVTDDNTGLSVLLRQWYNWNTGVESRTLTLFYGVAKGVTENAQRITSA